MNGYKVICLAGTDPILKQYESLIYSSFLKSLRFGNDWFKLIDANIYFSVYEKVIASLLQRGGTLVRLAVLDDDEDTCLGWSLTENKTLHYIYVKSVEKHGRKQGIGTSLLPPEFNQISHLTKIGASIWASKFPNVKFNPFQ